LEVGFIMQAQLRTKTAVLALAVALTGCVAEPTAPYPASSPAPVARPSPNVYYYPLQGQTAEQQDRDRYECYLWARRQTGYDPSLPHPDGGPPVQVLAMPPPGHDTLAGAATGAIIGAAVSDPWHSGEGAAVGAVAGAVLGAASDAGRQQTAQRVQSQQDAERQRADAQADALVLDYRSAMKSCLSARGYTVQ
jgi:hypothetical protein